MTAEEIELWEALLLGVVQGATEWLPISSSGHLVLAQEFLGAEVPVAYDLVLHLGTLLVVLFYYRRDLGEMARSLLRLPRDAAAGGLRGALARDAHRRLALFVVLGTLPAAAVGLAFGDLLLATFHDPRVVAVALLATGTMLWASRAPLWPAPQADLTWGRSLLIGAFQALALVPGVSRSGSTIAAATLAGVERGLAVRYSFLLSIPAIGGAVLVEAPSAGIAWGSAAAVPVAAGVLAAMLVGYASLALLVRIASRGGLHRFAYYCWAVGAATLAYTVVAS